MNIMSGRLASAAAAPLGRLDAAAWFATIAGLCASFIGIGLARFAYTPLIPPLIEAHWFPAAAVVQLSAANYAGYLAGALFGRALARALSNRWALRLLMVGATLAFFACAVPVSVAWFFAWRFIAGIAGGAIMVLVATTVLPSIPPARRGFAGGLIFLGVGIGMAASGTVVPALLHLGLRATWIGLGAVSCIATAISWFGWPDASPPAPLDAPVTPRPHVDRRALWILYGQYALNALGIVAAMLLLVDFIARGLGRGATAGAYVWVLYGLAAIAGPPACGFIGDRIGFRLAYRGALLLQASSLLLLALATSLAGTIGPALVLGALTPGIVPIVLGRFGDLLPGSHLAQRAAWSRATVGFALFQVIGGYGYAFLFTWSGDNYAVVFLVGAAALGLGFAMDLCATRPLLRAHP